MSNFCTKLNQPVDGEQCRQCFESQNYSTYRLRGDCTRLHLQPAIDTETPEVEMTPTEKLADAARAAREHIYHRGGHTAEAVEVVRYLDEALAGVRELEVA